MIRPGFRLLLAAALAGLPASAAFADAPSGAFAATVTRDKAVFSFPLDTAQQFQWNRAADQDGAVEYRWSVEVSDGGSKYQVGYFLLKAGSGEAGGLGDLLKAGQLGVFREDADGHFRMIDTAQVKADVKPGTLVLTISGAEAVDLVMSARPSSVTFEAATPGQAPDIEDVLVTYAY